MTSENIFAVKRIKNLDCFYVPFSPFTKLPFVECDPETFDDQIHFFDGEEAVKQYAEEQKKEKNLMQPVKISKEQAAGFWMGLYTEGVNAVLFHEGTGDPVRVDLEEICQKPDVEKLNAGKLPLLNPQLQLTAAYFMQELRRSRLEEMDAEGQKRLKDMEEELMVNLARGRFIIAVEVLQPEKGQEENENVRIPCIKSKNGEIYQPLFSDMGEFRKFYQKKDMKMRLGAVPFEELEKYLNAEARGFLLNPSSVQMVLSREQIRRIIG